MNHQRTCVQTASDLREMVNTISTKRAFAFDTETTGLHKIKDRLVGMSIGVKDKTRCLSWYIPLYHKKGKNIPLSLAVTALAPFFSSDKFTKFTFNGKFDNHFTTKSGFPKLAYPWVDIHPIMWLMDENNRGLGLNDLALTYCGFKSLHYKELLKKEEDARKVEWLTDYETVHGKITETVTKRKWKCPHCKNAWFSLPVCRRCGTDLTDAETEDTQVEKRVKPQIEPVLDISDVRVEFTSDYACDDVIATILLANDQYPKIQKFYPDPYAENPIPAQWVAYQKVEFPILEVTYSMEMAGLHVNMPFMEELNTLATKEREVAKQKVFDIIGKEINLNSHTQKEVVFFGELGLPQVDGTSMDKDTLKEWKRQGIEVAEWMIEYNEWDKLKSGFLDPLPEFVIDDILYTHFNPFGTRTGRFSSNSPNLQQTPRARKRYNYREGIYVPDGYRMLIADFSQMELVEVANQSGDPTMIAALLNGEDLHKKTIAYVLGIPIEEVTKEQRSIGKVMNFGLCYRQSPKGFMYFAASMDIMLTLEQAKVYHAKYFELYPGILDWHQKQIRFCKAHGYVETRTGRIRRLPQIYSDDWGVAEWARKRAINTPVQGTCADILKIGLVELHNRWDGCKVNKLIGTIHDEVLCRVPEENAEEGILELHDTFENILTGTVPLRLEAGIGRTWADKP